MTINLQNKTFAEIAEIFANLRNNCLASGMTETQIIRYWLTITKY